MTDTKITPRPLLAIGEPEPRPTINFKLTPMEFKSGVLCGVAVDARHSGDTAWQTIAEFRYNEDGHLQLLTRDIHAGYLMDAMGLAKRGDGITTVFLDKSI